MRNFNRNDRRERRDFGRPDYQEKRMFHATCANCGRDCEVPFKPRGDKPVYCKDCFRKQRDSHDGGGSHSAPQSNAGPQLNDQFAKLNAKLDKVLAMLNPVQSSHEEAAEPEKAKKPAAKKATAKKVVLKKAVRKKK